MRRNTKEREIVYDCIDNLAHATTKQIIDTLADKAISLATIYRNLTILVEEERVKKIRVASGLEVYETVKEDHFHFMCKKCKNIIDFDKSIIKVTVEDESYLKDAEIGYHDVVFYGLCPNCKKIEGEK